MSVITTAHYTPTRPDSHTATVCCVSAVHSRNTAVSLRYNHGTAAGEGDVCQRCGCCVGGTDSLPFTQPPPSPPPPPGGKTTTTESAQTEERFRGIISSSRKEATNLVYTQPTMNGDAFCSDRSFAVTVPEASVTIDFVLYRDQSNLSQ